DKHGPGIESWFGILNPVQSDSKAISERTYTSDGRITFAKFNSDLVPYSRKQAPEVLKTYLQLPLTSQATFLRSARVGDFDHDRFQQRYKGIRVENGIYTVVSKENTIELMMGEFYQVPEELSSSPKLSEAEALAKTLKHIGAKKYLWEVSEREAALKSKKNDPNASYFPKGELLVYQHSLSKSNSPKEFRLAYKFGITSIDPPSSRYVYVDSNSGEILSSRDARRYEAGGGDTIPSPPPTPPDTNYGICFPDQTPCIKQGSASTRFSGVKTITTYTSGEENHYELKDYSRGKGIITYSWEFVEDPFMGLYFVTVPIVDTSNNWTKFEYHDDYNHDALLDAHWGIEMTYDYFKSIHNWLGYDGNNSKVVNNVHYVELFAANNAFWDPMTEEIFYIYCPHNSICKTFGVPRILDPTYEDFTSLDVTSHEFGHGVNGAIAGLNYDPEPYALNEGFSDIWNIAVNNYVNKVLGMQKNLWLIADETVPGGGMRSAENPKSTTVLYPGPNTYYGDLWDFENNEPHTNSLVLSHWFYTLSKGKQGTNDHHCGYNV
ncbi:M4 family metallopeptidase, partial [Leptospira kirschneri]